MTKRVKLFQNERLDIEDAKNLQDMVYEYTQRAVHGILGQSDGLCGSGISTSISAATWSVGGGNNIVTLSGREYIQRSNKYHFDYAASAVPEGKSGAEVPAGSGKGTGQVWVFDSDLNEQATKVIFHTAIAGEGGPAGNWLTNGTKYSIFARRKTYDADVEGRIFWDADGGGQEVQLNKPTSQSEVVECAVYLSANADTHAKHGYVRIFDVVSVDADAGSDTYTQPTLRPHMAYDLASAKFSSSNTGNSVRTALENATANTSLSVDPEDVGGLTELLGYVVRQLGWMQEIASDFTSKTFQKPEGDLTTLFRFLNQYRASYKMPGLIWSGVIRADKSNSKWELGYKIKNNSTFQSQSGATAESQGVFIGPALPTYANVANPFGIAGLDQWLTLSDDSANWPTPYGPRFTPLGGMAGVPAAPATPTNSILPLAGPAIGDGSGLLHWYDLKLNYDSTKYKIVGVQVTLYGDIHDHDTNGLAAGGDRITSPVIAQTGTYAEQPVTALVYQNSIYVRTGHGTMTTSQTAGGQPRSICLTVFGYHDDGLGSLGFGANGIVKSVESDGPDETGGQGVG